MSTTSIDVPLLRALFLGGLQELDVNLETVNNLNVFPVPDGDTGNNMKLTMDGAQNAVASEEFDSVSGFMKKFSRGSLMGARGNSGVILSQFIKGFHLGCGDKAALGIHDFTECMVKGQEKAYAAVMVPTEGTILTVIRETAEYCSANDSAWADFEEYFAHMIPAMQASLERTPELLPILKESGVIDSGGAGLLCIFTGMEKALKGETDLENIDFGSYFRPEIYSGGCAGEHKKYAIVTVANGDGLKQYFSEIGADAVVDGGQTSNPSAADFIRAYDTLSADYIIVLPNNSNIVMAAEQSAKLYQKADVRVVPAKSVAEGYSALSMMNLDADSVEEIIEGMKESISGVTTGMVTTAIRDVDYENISVKKGHYIGLSGKSILSDSPDKLTAAMELLKAIPDIEDMAVIVVFRGKNLTDEELAEFESMLASELPDLEFGSVYGGQDVYDFIFSIE